jgi:RNA recognition motif-containing protein
MRDAVLRLLKVTARVFHEEKNMEEQKKLYIGNLNFDTNESDLKGFLEEKGVTPKEIKIISDKYTGKSKGFGFAEFETEEQAQEAINALSEQELAGRKLTVNKAKKMQPRKDNFGGGRDSGYRNNRY